MHDMSIPVARLNHAVLFVRDAERAADFYTRIFGFEVVAKEMGGQAIFLRSPLEENHHDLGLFSVGPQAQNAPRGSVGLYHLAWEVPTITDLAAFGSELSRPTLVSPATARLATTVVFPGLVGVVPGVGRFDPCDWGLGPELHDGKAPHWMCERNSPAAFGHIGGAGTFLWVDPVADLAIVVLTDREFGPWALETWPVFSDAVLASAGGPR